MSPPDRPGGIPLRLVAEDKAAEIFVLDGSLQVVARGAGAVEAMLPEGIYKIKVRAGLDAEERLLVHRPPGTTETFPLIHFSSPAPLDHTRERIDEHAAAAARESRVVHVTAGAGSGIFVFARDWAPPEQAAVAPAASPAAGLRLQRMTGEPVADIASSAVRQVGAGGPWAACTLELDPGLYQLSVALPNGEVFAQSVAACPGWQTQVFLLQRKDYRGTPGEPRPNLGSAAILMARGKGFDPDRKDMRWAELARQGLMNRRPVLSHEIREMLRYKVDNPMLGIFGGHLLGLEPQPDRELSRIVVENLRALVSMPHPDVEALALAAGVATSFAFAMPPMLRRSWTCVVDASAKRPALVPEGSPASKLFLRLTSQDPWLVWRQHDAAGEHDPVEDFVGALRSLVRRSGDLKEVVSSVRQRARAELQERVPDLLGRPEAPAPAAPPASAAPRPPAASIPDSVMEKLVARLGIPRASVESLVNEGVERLKLEPE